MNTYNGWENYETWNVSLWIRNDVPLYELAKECRNYLDFALELTQLGIDKTPDGVSFRFQGLSLPELDEVIREIE